MAVTIKQGDSCGIFLNLVQNNTVLMPSMVDDIEIYIGENLRLSAVEGGVKFDPDSKKWYIWPTQEQTFSLEAGTHRVEVRVKYKNQKTINVKGYDLEDRIKVRESVSEEVL